MHSIVTNTEKQMKAVQLRGNCQCCGRQQAVNGRMAKHGYTVDGGWFNGVCTGANHKPMQEDRTVTDKIVSDIRTQVATLLKEVEELKAGKLFPEKCGSGLYESAIDEKGRKRRVETQIDFKLANKYNQDRAIEHEVYVRESRARMGTAFAKDLEGVANAVHGTKLVEVKKEDAPARIVAGEKRTLGNGKVATVKYQDGARVYWTYQNSTGKEFQSWTGSQAWRKLPLVSEVK
jgi:hypothetical protein